MATLSNHPQLTAQEVGNAFVVQYYEILRENPTAAHKFYKDVSVVGRPGIDGNLSLIANVKEFNDKIKFFDDENCQVEIKSVLAQNSLLESVIVGVAGCLWRNNTVTRRFNQTFLLAPQAGHGFYVHNDFVQFVEASDFVQFVEAGKLSASLPVEDVAEEAPITAVPQHTTVPDNEQNNREEKVASRLPVVPDNEQNHREGKAASRLPEAKSSLSKKLTSLQLHADASKNVSVPASVQDSNVGESSGKVSYASMVLKEPTAKSPVSTSYTVVVSPFADHQSTAKPPPKPVDPSAKTSVPSANGPQKRNTALAEVKAIHIKGLPNDITEDGLVDAVKNFGPVQKNGVQIRTYADGFTYAFIEFESVESASKVLEAGQVIFKDRTCEVQVKKSSNQVSGNNYRGRSPSGRDQRFRNDNYRGRNGEDRGNRRYDEYDNQGNFRPERGQYRRNGNYQQDRPRGSSSGRYGNGNAEYQKKGVHQNSGEVAGNAT